MKSKKASEILERGMCYTPNDEIYFGDNPGCCNLIGYVDAFRAIEQAEADRDAKAIRAHLMSCESFYQGGCCGPHEPCTAECSYIKRFIEKLNEE